MNYVQNTEQAFSPRISYSNNDKQNSAHVGAFPCFVYLQKVNLSRILFMIKRTTTVFHVSSKFSKFMCQLDRCWNFDGSSPGLKL